MKSYLQKMAGTTNCATMKRARSIKMWKSYRMLSFPKALYLVKLSLEMKEMCTHIHRCNTNAVGQLSLCKERCVTGARTELWWKSLLFLFSSFTPPSPKSPFPYCSISSFSSLLLHSFSRIKHLLFYCLLHGAFSFLFVFPFSILI